MNDLSAFLIAGSGEAEAFERDLFDPKIRASIRYADQAAWITATAVTRALARAGDGWSELRHQIGMIVLGDQGPGATMAGMRGGGQGILFAAALRSLRPVDAGWRLLHCFWLSRPHAQSHHGPASWAAHGADTLPGVAGAQGRADDGGGGLPNQRLWRTFARALLLAPPGVLPDAEPLTASELAWLTAVVSTAGAGA